MRRFDKPICETLCDDCLYWADNDLAALSAAGLRVEVAGVMETMHNALNCIIHEEDNDPPDALNAVRIARAALNEVRTMDAAAQEDQR